MLNSKATFVWVLSKLNSGRLATIKLVKFSKSCQLSQLSNVIRESEPIKKNIGVSLPIFLRIVDKVL